MFPARPGQHVETLDGGSWEVGPDLELVAWTTTPWTTLANVGLAVSPRLTYRIVANPARPGGQLLFAEGLANPVPQRADSAPAMLRQLATASAAAAASTLLLTDIKQFPPRTTAVSAYGRRTHLRAIRGSPNR